VYDVDSPGGAVTLTEDYVHVYGRLTVLVGHVAVQG
jgi:hypothetical protein